MSLCASCNPRLLGSVLVAGLALKAFPAAALDAYPKTTLAEDVTATWCGSCPDAYTGLEVVHDAYHYGEFISVRYYSTSGELGTPETEARLSYYEISAFPTAIFDGLSRVVGDIIAEGTSYLPLVQAASLEPAPVRIEIDSFDPASGEVQATVTMYSETAVLSGEYIRFLLLEDDVDPPHTHVTRDIVTDTISLSGAGSSATFHEQFEIDPGWDPAELRAVVFVQRAGDKAVLQADSSYPEPDYSVRAMVPFERITLGQSTGTSTSPPFTLMNVGLADSFTIDLIVDRAPANWMASYRDSEGTRRTGPLGFALGPDESREFSVEVAPASAGSMELHLEVTSPNLPSPLVIPFSYVTDDADVLVVDDDGADDYERYYTAVLDSLGRSYGVWDRAAGELTDELLQSYHVVIWQVGEAYPTLDLADREFLRQHLAAGGSLFLTGQDIGCDLNDWLSINTDPAFFEDYLHATYLRHDTKILDLSGVSGDPITDRLTLHIAGGDGANNQVYPDEITPYDTDAISILSYDGDGAGAIRATDSMSGARVVYLAFGFEAIDRAQDRAELLGRALEWLRVERLLYRRAAGRRIPGGPGVGEFGQRVP